MQCLKPKLCIFCQETDNPKKLICIKYDFDINYTNLSKIENCQDKLTLQENRSKWRKLLANFPLK